MDTKKKMVEEIRILRNEFIKEFPDPNTRASLDSYSSVYVKWLEKKIIEQKHQIKEFLK